MAKYNEVKRKACVGERIKIVNRIDNEHRYENGDEFMVMADWGAGDVRVDVAGDAACVFLREYVVLEPVPEATPQPAASVPQLPELFAQFLRDNSAAVRAYLDAVDQQAGGPVTEPIVKPAETIAAAKPLTRADVLAQASADVAELLRIGRSDDDMLSGSKHFRARWYDVDFVVNREKRTVVALVYEINGLSRTFARYRSKPDAKGIARCAPDDVFHTDIGRAIALRRALGLVVPIAYTQAPKPEEPRVGAKVRGVGDDNDFGVIGTVTEMRPVDYLDADNGLIVDTFSGSGWNYIRDVAVIDDTDVVYDVDYAKEAE
ncbi:hypothetical protein [Paenibacillus sp. YN15]|uniref:hypothetical protein n=1 Tax=Paenibacillus sp. YN15 TaxID=1742774 RepID=UPI000DCEBD19|nr:hypothetical protein [Paenibacillus sp. YN15]RAU96815.1 hypothetical protein DQG13_19875 [Paenibacillus sp. YN15]